MTTIKVWVRRLLAALVLLAGASQAADLYFVHTDHLGTPRLIANATGQTVWQWANDDPFGNNVPNENPSGLGTFTCDLRFPGQYFDRETGTHYNYYRDYDPSQGRYIQSDPIGLGGGVNTYGYVGANPLSFADPLGLYTTVVCRPVKDPRVQWIAKHCFVVVWHWSDTCPPQQIIDKQYSLAGNPTFFPQNSNAPTFRDDRNAWNTGTGYFYDIQPPAGQSVGDFDANVIRQGDLYNSGNGYSANGITGPNSNTAAQQIIQGAGGTMPNIPGAFGQSYRR